MAGSEFLSAASASARPLSHFGGCSDAAGAAMPAAADPIDMTNATSTAWIGRLRRERYGMRHCRANRPACDMTAVIPPRGCAHPAPTTAVARCVQTQPKTSVECGLSFVTGTLRMCRHRAFAPYVRSVARVSGSRYDAGHMREQVDEALRRSTIFRRLGPDDRDRYRSRREPARFRKIRVVVCGRRWLGRAVPQSSRDV